MTESPTIFVTAADASGDAHAAGLIEALRARLGKARFVGVGGERMAEAGCELLSETVRRATMLTGPAGDLAYYLGVIRKVAQAMDRRRPALHVPVDSPALNWHLARAAKRRKVPVMYYIAPQVWAWAPWRVGKLRRLTDAVACILPFEEAYLRARGVAARFVGHPVLDRLPPASGPDFAQAAAEGRWRIALLPGSREGEIKAHAPALAKAADRLRESFPRAEFVFSALDAASAELIRRTGRSDLAVVVGDAAGVLARSHFALAASGTVTLQAAHFGVPMVVFYRVSRWGYWLLGSWLLRTPYLSLVNILAGEELVPELMPWFGDAERLAGEARALLDDAGALGRLRERLMGLVKTLTGPGGATAADNAAALAVEVMDRSAAG